MQRQALRVRQLLRLARRETSTYESHLGINLLTISPLVAHRIMEVSTRIVGFIRPPPDIRVIVDKTAAFVARMGDEVEMKLSAAEASNLKFNFLRSDDPYHAYYRHKVTEGRNGGGGKSETGETVATTAAAAESGTNGGSGGGSRADEKTAVKAEGDGKAAVEGAGAAAPEASGSSRLIVRGAAPPNPLARALRAFDPAAPPPVDVFSVEPPALASPRDIETARLVAQFTAAGGRSFLSTLSARAGAADDFPFLRPTHALFSFFTKLVDAYAAVLRLAPNVESHLQLLSRRPDSLLERATARIEIARRAAAAEASSSGALEAAAAIDWHDFSVVETIDFEDDQPELEQVGAAGEDEPNPTPPLPPTGEKLLIRTDYVPTVRAAAPASAHFMHPITGAVLPIDGAADTLRIELMDPKWTADRAKAAARAALPSTLAPAEDVAANLRMLAGKREDVFGNVAAAATVSSSADAPKSKRERIG